MEEEVEEWWETVTDTSSLLHSSAAHTRALASNCKKGLGKKEAPHLQSDGEHQHSEDNCPKGPVPKNLKKHNTLPQVPGSTSLENHREDNEDRGASREWRRTR